MSMVTGTALVSTNRQKLGLNLTIAAVAVNISLNVLLIPKTATWVHRLQLWSRKPLRERAAYFRFSYRRGCFSTITFENAPLTLITIIDLRVYAAVIYKFGIDYDNKRLILGLLKAGRLTKTEM